MLDQIFHLKENHTTVKTEIIGGVTTFVTMAYILAVNPQILSVTGMDRNAVLMATAIASFVGTVFMAFVANYPFALAPGLGLNAYFAYTVCVGMGYSWQLALLAVFVEGILFIVLSLTRVREVIFYAIPLELKKGIAVGLGFFVAFIGLQNAGLVVGSDSTLVTVLDFRSSFYTQGIGAILALVGLFVIVILAVKKIKGAILIGIIVTWVLGMICELFGIYVTDPLNGHYSLFPVWTDFRLGAIGETFGQCFNVDFSGISVFQFLVVVFAFMFVDIFNTLGTVIGVAQKTYVLNEDGEIPRIREVLLADAVATSVGAVLGTSTTTTFVESAAGVSEGARTGLSSMVTGMLFLVSIFLSPIFCAIPAFATAPALIYVGFLMITDIISITFDNLTEAIPAYLCIIGIPLFYSISEGIAIGVLSYVFINHICGKRNKITILMYILAVLFVVKYTVF